MTTLNPGQFAKHAGWGDKLRGVLNKILYPDEEVFRARLKRSLDRATAKSSDDMDRAMGLGIYRRPKVPRPHSSVQHIADAVDALPSGQPRSLAQVRHPDGTPLSEKFPLTIDELLAQL